MCMIASMSVKPPWRIWDISYESIANLWSNDNTPRHINTVFLCYFTYYTRYPIVWSTYPKSLNLYYTRSIERGQRDILYLIFREIGCNVLFIDCLTKADIDTSPLVDRNNHAFARFVIPWKLEHVSDQGHSIGRSENHRECIYWWRRQ